VPSKRRVRGEISTRARGLLRDWRKMPAEERRAAYDEIFRKAETDPRQREELIKLFNWLVINAPRPRGGEPVLSVAQQNSFARPGPKGRECD
jgi:hypothetical protein